MAGFCGGCGQPLPEGAYFCVACGRSVAPDPGAGGPPVEPGAAPEGYAPGAAPQPYGAQPGYGTPYAIPPASALPPRPAMSRKTLIVTISVVVAIGLGYVGWTAIPPLFTSPASVADQLVKAAVARNNGAVASLVAPELGAKDSADVLDMLADPTVTPAFTVESQQGLSAVTTMRAGKWDYRLTVSRAWNQPWRVSRIELSSSEVVTETVYAPGTSEYVDWEMWPSSAYEVNLSDAVDGERSYTVRYTMVNGVSDQVEGSSTVTLEPVAAKVLRGTGPALDTYGSAYYPNSPGLVGTEFSLSMQVAIDPSVGAAAPKGAKLQAHIRTPTGFVVDSDVITNSGKADADSYYYMTAEWNWTPGLVNQKGDTAHPTDEWLPGTYAIVYTSDDEVVGANYWQSGW
jgi:hypothetical protein